MEERELPIFKKKSLSKSKSPQNIEEKFHKHIEGVTVLRCEHFE